MSEDISGVEPRGNKEVRPRPADGAEANAGRIAVEMSSPAAPLQPRSAWKSRDVPYKPGIVSSYLRAMQDLRSQAAKQYPGMGAT